VPLILLVSPLLIAGLFAFLLIGIVLLLLLGTPGMALDALGFDELAEDWMSAVEPILNFFLGWTD
jgi:hypothetical protein